MTSDTKKPSGGQIGNTNQQVRGAFAAMLRRKVTQNPKKLEAIVDNLLTLAEAGESWAVRELSDRLDGKAIAAVEMSGPDGNPIEVEQAGTFAKELMAVLLSKRQKESGN